jgi:hypothetical protein
MAPSKQEIKERPCGRCKTLTFLHPNGLYCLPCKKLIRKEHEAAWQSVKQARRKKLAFEVAVAKSKPVPIFTDKEQREIDRACDNRHAIKLDTKILTPEEIAAIAHTIRPLNTIPQGSIRRFYLHRRGAAGSG